LSAEDGARGVEEADPETRVGDGAEMGGARWRDDAGGVSAGARDDASELDEAPAYSRDAQRRSETLAGFGAPSGSDTFDFHADDALVEDDADGGTPERSSVVRKPRAPVSDDDLDWADILVPEPDDAEDGS
jgi:hypothetical protein